MVYFGIWLIVNVHKWLYAWIKYSWFESMWMLVTLSFALLCCTWSTSDGDVPGWSECCCRDVWLGGNGSILQTDDPSQSLRVISKLFMMAGHMAATTNQRACGRIRFPWRGSRGEADQRDQRLLIPSDTFWYKYFLSLVWKILEVYLLFRSYCYYYYILLLLFLLLFIIIVIFFSYFCILWLGQFLDSPDAFMILPVTVHEMQLNIIKWDSVTFSETYSVDINVSSRCSHSQVPRNDCPSWTTMQHALSRPSCWFAVASASSNLQWRTHPQMLTMSLKRVRIRWRKKIIWWTCIISKHL